MAAPLTGERWIWVSLPCATFALGVKDGVVVDAPPYAWEIMQRTGTDQQAVAAYLRRRGAVFCGPPELTSARRLELLRENELIGAGRRGTAAPGARLGRH